MPFAIPTDTLGFTRFIAGANSFYKGEPRSPDMFGVFDLFDRQFAKGWDFAARMTYLGRAR